MYENKQLAYIMIDGARIKYKYKTSISQQIPPPIPLPKDDNYTQEYEFYLTDHLGNVRVVFNEDKEIVQENDYYPYGLLMQQTMHNAQYTNNYLYNSNELQNFTNYYAYGFRQLDPQLGRWHSVDKLAEDYISASAYSYASNNPIANIDVAGLLPYSNFDKYGYSVGGGDWGSALGGGGSSILTDYQSALANGFSGSIFDYKDGLENGFSTLGNGKYVINSSLSSVYDAVLNGYLSRYYTSIDGRVYKLNLNGQDISFKGSISINDLENMLDGGDGGLGLLWDMYTHYKFGGGDDYFVDISKLDLSMIKSSMFDYVGQEKNINMANLDPMSAAGLAFGEIRFEYLGDNKVRVVDFFSNDAGSLSGKPYYDTFNFNVRWEELFSGVNTQRNIVTFFGGKILNAPIPINLPIMIYSYGGEGYSIYFSGIGTIGN